jgi:hypothetical protein
MMRVVGKHPKAKKPVLWFRARARGIENEEVEIRLKVENWR